jgi:hypothetical protein
MTEPTAPDRAARELALQLLNEGDGYMLDEVDTLARYIAFGELPQPQEPTK